MIKLITATNLVKRCISNTSSIPFSDIRVEHQLKKLRVTDTPAIRVLRNEIRNGKDGVRSVNHRLRPSDLEISPSTTVAETRKQVALRAKPA